MSDTKRHHGERDSQSPTPPAHNRPGRKPIQTDPNDPKNKRIAQNRAAQRAFRERKERKMRELEIKVETLESEKKQMSNESEFLRIQVETLMQELNKSRGKKGMSDMLPNGLAISSSDGGENTTTSASNVSDSPGSDMSSNTSTTTPASSKFKFDFPWKQNKQATGSLELTKTGSSSIPELAESTKTFSVSSKSSPATNNDTALDFKANGSTEFRTGTDTLDHFDENVDSFCTKLGSACGTKECPIPKSMDARSIPPSDILSRTTNDVMTATMTAPSPFGLLSDNLNKEEDPLAFLNDSPFDPVVVFENAGYGSNDFNNYFDNEMFQQDDVVSGLVTEESKYDPFSAAYDEGAAAAVTTANLNNLNRPNAAAANNDDDDDDIDENAVVPADVGMMKCSEVWERITTHPRFSELDIDGLCNELKQKAKCSEKGVVLSNSDVSSLLNNADGKTTAECNSFLRV